MNKLLIFTLLVFSMMSCSHDINSDSKQPVIEDLTIVNLDSVNNIVFPTGTNVQFSANFIDNQELGSYRFDIHFAGDGHRHSHIDPKKATQPTREWGFTKNGEIEGTEHKITFSKRIEFKDDEGQTIDAEANSGPYHCVVYAVDKAGNSASFVQKNFLIVNADMPTYDITEPDFTDYKISVGATMNIKGSVYGKKGLSKLAYFIYSFENEDAENIIYNSELIKGDVKEFTLDIPIVIPSDVTPGKYIIVLLASDKVGNVGEFLNKFEITN